MEVMRDKDDNVVIICSIENFDPMGVHTGDSITVAPAQTLTDKEYQRMRDASIAVMREIGVETGGSNIQFAIDPADGRMVVIEMNPRVSRSSALASKATGFPIAKIAAKLAIGYRLHELPNDITRETKACFEPTIDYVVTKIPRFAFEKFPEADAVLTTQMKSVGETMAIGRTFKESFQKALRGLEVGSFGFGCDGKDLWGTAEQPSLEEVKAKLTQPNEQRVWYLRYAIKYGVSIEEIYELTGIDPWFLENLLEIVEMEERLRGAGQPGARSTTPRCGWPSSSAFPTGSWPRSCTRPRWTSAPTASGGASWPRSSRSTPAPPSSRPTRPITIRPTKTKTRPRRDKPGQRRVMILGGGPNRIGQGIEFDYCCCHASFALRELGIQSIMVNSNPETVSTDYDTSDLLFFEPLTTEDVLNICDRIQPDGVIVQFGGQTPLNLARALSNAGVPIIGTSVDTIEDAEDREKFAKVLERLNLKQPANGIARNMAQARIEVAKIGYPVLVRPSFVLGGRAMEICYDSSQFERFVAAAFVVAQGQPVLIDRFLEDATEVDVDAIADGQQVIVCGIMEHIEEAGVHSGDSACAIPPYSLPGPVVARDPRGHLPVGPAHGRPRADEHPVRGEEGRRPADGLHPRSQPAGQPHGAVRLEGHGRAVGQGGGQGDGRRDVGRAGNHPRSDPLARLGQGGRLPLREVHGRRYRAGPGDEIDRRGDGRERPLLDRLCQEPTGGRDVPAHQRQDLHQRGRAGEGPRRRAGPAAGEAGLRAPGHAGHGGEDRGGRHSRAAVDEALAGASQRLGLHSQRRLVPDHEHAQRQGCADRRGPDSRRGRLARHTLHHHAPGRRRRRLGHGGPAAGRDHRAGRAGQVSGKVGQAFQPDERARCQPKDSRCEFIFCSCSSWRALLCPSADAEHRPPLKRSQLRSRARPTAQSERPDDPESIAAALKLGGILTRDDKSEGRPITGLDLRRSRATDPDLKFLHGLPHLEKLRGSAATR